MKKKRSVVFAKAEKKKMEQRKTEENKKPGRRRDDKKALGEGRGEDWTARRKGQTSTGKERGKKEKLGTPKGRKR